MAHFSGQDTLYSKKITPLLLRYQHYLRALHGGITMPIFYFMLCFRALFQVSLSKRSRQREFRADKIAAESTTSRDFAAGLLRVVAYSKFRNQVEHELFKQEQLETADVAARIERGFPAYAARFASDPNIGLLETTHPFDSHPPLSQRLAQFGITLGEHEARSLLGMPGDGGWRRNIPAADELEQQQWQAFEDQFREHHEATLPYRFLPETAEEREIVERAFPVRTFDGKEGQLTFDFEKMHYAPWADAIYYREITKCDLDEHGMLQILFTRGSKDRRTIKTTKLNKGEKDAAVETLNQYYGRYLTAVAYQEEIRLAAAAARRAEES
jgi:hypothetical protein